MLHNVKNNLSFKNLWISIFSSFLECYLVCFALFAIRQVCQPPGSPGNLPKSQLISKLQRSVPLGNLVHWKMDSIESYPAEEPLLSKPHSLQAPPTKSSDIFLSRVGNSSFQDRQHNVNNEKCSTECWVSIPFN